MGSTLQKQNQAYRLAMVQTAQQHRATMERAERQVEYTSKMVAAFSLYIGERYIKILSLVEWLFPDLEDLTPEMQAQIDQRLDQGEQNFDRIEQRTVQKMINNLCQTERE
jgi:hypothetical protein